MVIVVKKPCCTPGWAPFVYNTYYGEMKFKTLFMSRLLGGLTAAHCNEAGSECEHDDG